MIIFINILFITIIGIYAFSKLAPQVGQKPQGKDLERVKRSKNYEVDRFKTIAGAGDRFNFRDLFAMMHEFVFAVKDGRPSKKLPSEELKNVKWETDPYLTWFGHSTFLYEVSGKKILFDPMLGSHAAPVPFGVKRFDYDLPATADHLPKLDYVIISHDHYDHLDYKTIKKIKNKVGKFLCPLGVGSHLKLWGVEPENIIEFDWGREFVTDDIKITAVPSRHFSGRSFDDKFKTLWAAWIIENEESKVFFGGDSGYFDGFKKIGKKYGPFDLTLLDSAQYNVLWKDSHMTPEDAIKAHEDLKGKKYMPIHWAAFTLSTHTWTDPIERALKEARKEGVNIITPMIGQRFNILKDTPRRKWWKNYM